MEYDTDDFIQIWDLARGELVCPDGKYLSALGIALVREQIKYNKDSGKPRPTKEELRTCLFCVSLMVASQRVKQLRYEKYNQSIN